MNKIRFTQIFFAAAFLVFCFPNSSDAYYGEDPIDSFEDPRPRYYPGIYDGTPVYTSHDYQYDFKNYGRYARKPGYRYTSPYTSYGTYDEFSPGISSYQGTSTGPGPNGGYPGTPHGVYKTHYLPEAHPVNYSRFNR